MLSAHPLTALEPTNAPMASPEAGADDPKVEDAAMSAALLLAGFAASTTSEECAAASSPTLMSAHQLTHFVDATENWPVAPGKGCFFKGRDGKDLYFLERLFLLLSFPNLELPGFPGRRLQEAIRWKAPASLEAMGLPCTLAAFEIGDVALLEAAVYPQYASGAQIVSAV